jgi:hypothetical protein
MEAKPKDVAREVNERLAKLFQRNNGSNFI